MLQAGSAFESDVPFVTYLKNEQQLLMNRPRFDLEVSMLCTAKESGLGPTNQTHFQQAKLISCLPTASLRTAQCKGQPNTPKLYTCTLRHISVLSVNPGSTISIQQRTSTSKPRLASSKPNEGLHC